MMGTDELTDSPGDVHRLPLHKALPMSVTTITAETEPQLIARAQQAVSQCNWDVGECAALWTKRYARGRTDADFAQLVGLSPDQIYQRRRVWETFGDVRDQYGQLKWSHFYSSIAWEDAAECLQWAQDSGSTVAEMKAWRRAQRGEDLSTAADDQGFDWLPMEAAEVRVPGSNPPTADGARGEGNTRERDATMVPVAAGVAREFSGSGDDYAPFSPDAITPPRSSEASERPRPAPSHEQLIRRLATTLERCAAAITDDFCDHFESLPQKERQRFLAAAAALQDKIAELG